MPVRRSRAEQLALVPPGGGDPILLFAETREPGELATQDVFQVSPDGAYLAYAANGTLHIRATDGTERSLPDYARFAHMRFSPDGADLAAVVGDPTTGKGQRVILFALASGETRTLGAFTSVQQLEWTHDAVVVRAWDSTRQHEVLTALPLEGEPAILLERPSGDIEQLIVAGTRIVAFVRDTAATHVLSIDETAPAAPHELGIVPDEVTNAAASLDGQRVAFTTATALFAITGDEHPRTISDRGSIQSLWFAHDGRLGYASQTSVTILDGGGAHRFDREGPISMLRFAPTSSRALVATPAHAWDISPAKPHRLASAPAGREIVGVDEFGGSLVVWTTAPAR
jgi:hypothetical protein